MFVRTVLITFLLFIYLGAFICFKHRVQPYNIYFIC